MTAADSVHGRHIPSLGESVFESSRGAAPRVDRPVEQGPDFVAIRNYPAFEVLRRKQRMFAFPVSVLFMAWYLVFVLLAAYSHDFMSIRVLGAINVGMVLGLAQFVSTVLIMLAYCRYARRHLDPVTDQIVDRSGETL
ncbi:MAG: DUF485 domain-containing protein [Pseudonocardia sp.]|nr:DUF485 domain-containing protein [Pseudonocardia sp.]